MHEFILLEPHAYYSLFISARLAKLCSVFEVGLAVAPFVQINSSKIWQCLIRDDQQEQTMYGGYMLPLFNFLNDLPGCKMMHILKLLSSS